MPCRGTEPGNCPVRSRTQNSLWEQAIGELLALLGGTPQEGTTAAAFMWTVLGDDRMTAGQEFIATSEPRRLADRN
jgi:hypothetical protein